MPRHFQSRQMTENGNKVKISFYPSTIESHILELRV